VQNYIDDTGVQVADVVVGFQDLEGRSVDEVRTGAPPPGSTTTAGTSTPGDRVVRRR
jgi:arginyl-tRNA synthetase